MASLNIGYWVILFSLVSAQLTASGGEACDMQSFSCHTEEESEVALMQIKARGSKLLLQQAVERLSGLSGKPQKSKQHLEKITEDVKALAAQALIAKNQSTNITAGGITDNLTIAALITMNESAQEIVDQAVEEAAILRNLLTARSDDLEACQNLLEGPLDSTFESAHDTCRQSETELYVAAKLAYEAAINNTPPPNCTKNWISTCTNPASTFYSIENSNERKDCLSSIRNWTQHLNGSVQSVNASSYQLFVDKKTECNSRQETYETKFCEHRKDSVSGCQEALRCYEREKPVYDEQAELVGSPNGAHKSAYAAGKTIQCLIDKLLRNLSETAIASCNATQVNTSSLDIEIQTPSSFPPWDCELSLDVHPCTDSWMQIYFNKPWYTNSSRADLNAEYNITCQTTGCAETYTQVYPGFPVAKGPDVWFKETNLPDPSSDVLVSWDDLGENEYQCPIVSVSASRLLLVKRDENSCLNTVQFSGNNAFENTDRNNLYRPNIDDDGTEVWVVAKADNINGIKFMVDNGEYAGNGLGFFFNNDPPNVVVAYAKDILSTGVIPATTSGLNVWRAQWKDYDSSESRDAYITVSLNNLVLANETINNSIAIDYNAGDGNDNVDSKYFTLGGQSKASNKGDRFFDGEIAEVMIFDYILSHDEAAMVKYALWKKWGIQGGSGSCSTTSTSTIPP